MEIIENERREFLEEQRKLEIASLRRLLNHHDEFFNFINLNEVWYRWVSGKYSVTSIDSMGETLIQYVCAFCEDHYLSRRGEMSSDRILVLDYKGVYFILRKLDGKDEFSAVSLLDQVHNFRVISWEKLNSYLEQKLQRLLAEDRKIEIEEQIADKSFIKE